MANLIYQNSQVNQKQTRSKLNNGDIYCWIDYDNLTANKDNTGTTLVSDINTNLIAEKRKW